MARKRDNEHGFYTDTRVDVTKRIEEGLTAFFKCKLKAEEHARQARSYPYPVFSFGKRLLGYGVPK